MTRVSKDRPITARDMRAVAVFGHELRIMSRLIAEGHARDCARDRVFAEPARTECGCIEANELRKATP